MARPSTTISAFRQAASRFMNSYEEMEALVTHCNMMGWNVSTWTDELTGKDITPAQFQAALDIIGPMKSTLTSVRPTLEPLRD